MSGLLMMTLTTNWNVIVVFDGGDEDDDNDDNDDYNDDV